MEINVIESNNVMDDDVIAIDLKIWKAIVILIDCSLFVIDGILLTPTLIWFSANVIYIHIVDAWC